MRRKEMQMRETRQKRQVGVAVGSGSTQRSDSKRERRTGRTALDSATIAARRRFHAAPAASRKQARRNPNE
jgi:hypothetical protein